MPNQKSNKGKKNKRANSSGDEQENGALAASGASGPGGALGAVAAAGTGGPAAAASGGAGGAGGAAAATGSAPGDAKNGRLMHLYAVCVDCLEGVHKIICIKCKSRWDGSWHQLGTMYTYDILAASPCCQARLNCKHCGKPVIDVRIGMQYFSEYSNVQQCPHCGNLDYHFVKPFSSFKVLEAY
uniref:Headcase protein homolog isoform X3 n=1 Tax=Pogona vitticeps TaxID=103695 RepID=A0ABM5G391_9SAUR